jgi:hypothetical protein
MISVRSAKRRGGSLKDWAGKTLPDLERHLQMAQNLEK